MYKTTDIIHAIKFRQEWLIDALKDEDYRTARNCAEAVKHMINEYEIIQAHNNATNGMDDTNSKDRQRNGRDP